MSWDSICLSGCDLMEGQGPSVPLKAASLLLPAHRRRCD